jgi:hypothetical protein
MMDAYPNVDAWLNSRNEYLFAYLRANRNQAGVPMQRLTPAQINAVEVYVAAHL